MAERSGSITVDCTPDEAWKLVSDAGALDEWMPMIETCEFDGESRRMDLSGGLGTLVEKILEVDDANRVLRYTITEAPFTPEKYVATWTVEPEGDATTVTWTMEVEPDDIADLLGGTIEGALGALKAHLES